MSAEIGWAKMPCSWQTDGNQHRKFLNGSDGFQGAAIAALKLYVALCLKANFTPQASLPDTGCVQRSLSQLAELVGLSRPMVIRGLRLLKAYGIVGENKAARPVIYHITDYKTARYWTKLPRNYLYGNSMGRQIPVLKAMSNRSKTTLHSLMLYLYLAAIRDKNTSLARVTYEHLTAVLGLNRNDVAKAISNLIAYDLISVRLADPKEFAGEYPSNLYRLRGSLGVDEPTKNTTIGAFEQG